jgi:hypothetical protein
MHPTASPKHDGRGSSLALVLPKEFEAAASLQEAIRGTSVRPSKAYLAYFLQFAYLSGRIFCIRYYNQHYFRTSQECDVRPLFSRRVFF